ncbi:hypothetical protein QBC45DRAFT_157785 [Copromyces sp. CBS 386.78]|nr:hypothetical protein QBC45DRAFT_157785 [Copromyces sp. CBS 386.78]
MPGTRSHRSRGKPSFLKRSSTKGSSKNETPEIIQQLARAALVYSLKRLTRQDSAEKASTSRQQPRSRSAHGDKQPNERDRGTTIKARDSSRASHRSDRDRDRDRDGTRDGNDLHDVMGQLAVGILGFGIRHFLHQRKKKEKEEKNKIKPPLYSTITTQGPRPSGEYPYTSYADYLAATSNTTGIGTGTRSRSLPTDGPGTEAISLATTLDSLKKELRTTSEALAELVNKTPSHKKCEVHDALAKRAEGIRASIDNLEMAVNNVRNLHPEIDHDRGAAHGEVGKVGEEGKVRSGKEEKGKGKEGADEKRKEGEVEKERGNDDGWGEREGRRRDREKVRRHRDDGRWSSRDRERKPRRSVEFEDDLDRYGYSGGSGRREYRRRRK